MHFLIQLCTSLLSYIKITSNTLGSTPTCFDLLRDHLRGVIYLFISLSMFLILKIIKIFKKYYQFIVVVEAYV
jgi:hypothetical protein